MYIRQEGKMELEFPIKKCAIFEDPLYVFKNQCFKMGAVIFKSNNCKCYGKQHKMLKKLSLLLA